MKVPLAARAANFELFRTGTVDTLIATDICSRGIDLPGLSLVVNFEFPSNTTDYLHRVGRTGRHGKPGTVISLLTKADLPRATVPF